MGAHQGFDFTLVTSIFNNSTTSQDDKSMVC